MTAPAAPATSRTPEPAVLAPGRAALAAFVTFLIIGIPTDILPNPLFGREIPLAGPPLR